MLCRLRVLRALPPSKGAHSSRSVLFVALPLPRRSCKKGQRPLLARRPSPWRNCGSTATKDTHKEDAERLQREAAVRTMETYLEKQMDTCVEECGKWAQVDGHYSHAFSSKWSDATAQGMSNLSRKWWRCCTESCHFACTGCNSRSTRAPLIGVPNILLGGT